MNETNKGAATRLVLVLIGLVLALAIGAGAYVWLNATRQQTFLEEARSACSEAAKVDYEFSKLLESPGHSRDQVIEQSSMSAKRIGELSSKLGDMSAGGAGDIKQNLCKALDYHRKIYEAIGDSAQTGEMTQVSEAVDSAWESYGRVDGKKIPLAGVLPGLAANTLLAGLTSMEGAPPIASRPQPGPAVASEPEASQLELLPEESASEPVVAAAPTAPKPAAVAKAAKKKMVVAKKRKPVRTRTATYRCPYRGCNAWFIKSSLLQRHKKYCIYRPGGPAAKRK